MSRQIFDDNKDAYKLVIRDDPATRSHSRKRSASGAAPGLDIAPSKYDAFCSECPFTIIPPGVTQTSQLGNGLPSRSSRVPISTNDPIPAYIPPRQMFKQTSTKYFERYDATKRPQEPLVRPDATPERPVGNYFTRYMVPDHGVIPSEQNGNTPIPTLISAHLDLAEANKQQSDLYALTARLATSPRKPVPTYIPPPPRFDASPEELMRTKLGRDVGNGLEDYRRVNRTVIGPTTILGVSYGIDPLPTANVPIHPTVSQARPVHRDRRSASLSSPNMYQPEAFYSTSVRTQPEEQKTLARNYRVQRNGPYSVPLTFCRSSPPGNCVEFGTINDAILRGHGLIVTAAVTDNRYLTPTKKLCAMCISYLHSLCLRNRNIVVYDYATGIRYSAAPDRRAITP